MTKATYDILFKAGLSTMPSNSLRIPVFDLESAEEKGNKALIFPYNNAEEGWSLESEERAERYILERLLNEGYSLKVAVYGNEKVGYIVHKDAREGLIVFVLDSESEKRVWLSRMGKERLPVFVIRDRLIKEVEGSEGVTLDEAFSSFNFLSR